MFKGIFKNPNKITSVNDFRDERAREIINKYGLEIREIFPRYSELTKEVTLNGGEIEIDPENMESPDAHAVYRKKIACAQALTYELTKRDKIVLPYTMKGDKIKVGGEEYTATQRTNAFVEKNMSVEVYERLGDYYGKVIELINLHEFSTGGKPKW